MIERHFELSSEVHKLAVSYENAMCLLGDVITTFRLPANRVLIAKQLPELVPVIDSFIHRYAKWVEGK